MFAQLFPAGGGAPIPLLKERVILGRSSKCDIVIPSRAVSGQHCKLRRKQGYWWVTDLDSRNGTAINGVKCRTQRILPNDILCVPKMRFRFEYEIPSDGRQMSDESLAMSVLAAPDASPPQSHSTEQVVSQDVSQDVSPPPEQQPKPNPSTTRPTPGKSAVAASDSAAPAGMRMKKYLGKLVPCGGGPPIPLLQPVLAVGRSSESDIRLKVATVSSRHCTLTYEGGYWFVEDLGSSNGVKVNSERVDRRLLMPENRLSISSQHFTIEYEPEGEPPYDPGLCSKSLLEKAGLQDILKAENAPAWITSHEKTDDDAPRRYRLDDSDL